ncbi:MFS transporter [Streptomyces vinaceus]|uniref:MFS transporter n=1 Tax=Streptomyces vinaceus TaxID=1960 RepID=UPI003804694C
MTREFSKSRYRAILSGITLNAFGNGLMAPYVISWLAALPHGSIRAAGVVFGATGAGQLLATLYAGRLLTTWPARSVLAAGLALSALAAALLTSAHSVTLSAVVLFCLGSFQGIASAAQATVLGTLKFGGGNEGHVWSHLQVVLNIGQGAGFLVGGYLVTGDLTEVMRPVFLLNAVSFAAFAAVAFLVLPKHSTAMPRTQSKAGGSYRSVLAQPAARQLILADLIFFTFGIGFLLLLPLLASHNGVLTMHQVAMLLAANTLIIVCGQLTITRLAQRLRQAVAVRLLFIGAAASWVLVAVGIEVASRSVALAVVWVAIVLFSVTECLHTARLIPQLREAVTDPERPRILSLHVFASKAGLIAGPALGGIATASSAQLTWLTAACVLLVPVLFGRVNTTLELPQKAPV